MRYITFNTILHKSDRNYPDYKFGRLCVINGTMIQEVYNTESDAIYVKSFNITVEDPFDTEFRYARVYINKQANRAYIHLIYKNVVNDIRYFGTLFSRYLYLVKHKQIPKDYQVDHIDGNKTNDILTNLIAIHKEHNFLKANYGQYWLHDYNRANNTCYIEQDLLDKDLLNKVIEFVEQIRPGYRKEQNKDYYRKNAEQLKISAKEYRLKNIDRILERDREYHHKNKEERNLQQKEYWHKNSERFKKEKKEYYIVNKEKLTKNRKKHYEENKHIISKKQKLYRQENEIFIKSKKKLFWKLDNLINKQWTIDIGKQILKTLDDIFKLYNLTIQEINKGLDIVNYKSQVINSLQRLSLLYSEQYNKLHD